VTNENCNIKDKFRIQLYEYTLPGSSSQGRQIGQKEFSAVVMDNQSKKPTVYKEPSETGSVFNDTLLQPVQESGVNFDSLPTAPYSTRLGNMNSGQSIVQTVQHNQSPTTNSPSETATSSARNGSDHKTPNQWCIALTCLCILALLMPTADYGHQNCSKDGKNGSSDQETLSNSQSMISLQFLFPTFLHITVTQKLIAAFTLGLLTMAMIQNA